MHPLTVLICGDNRPSGAISEILAHLSDTLDKIIVKAVKVKKSSDKDEIALFGPLLARSAMEVSFTAITARIDPLRVLAIRRTQMGAKYDMGTRNSIAYNWATDVRGEKPKELEDITSGKDLSRALLGKHCGELIWSEAHQSFMDQYSSSKIPWLPELAKIDPELFVDRAREEADRLYSELSKAIHAEFVIPLTNKLDSTTVVDLIDTTFKMIGWVGLIASYSPITISPKDDPISLIENAYEELKI